MRIGVFSFEWNGGDRGVAVGGVTTMKMTVPG